MRVLLHCCCGPCASHCIYALREAGHEVALYYSNANIAPEAEFEKRLDSLRKLADAAGAPLIVDPPDHGRWLEEVAKGFELEPEKGARCPRCFRYSLARTAAAREAGGFDAFTTSLTVSPHKPTPVVFGAARETDAAHFLAMDFKKRDGFLDSVRRAKALGLYRQSYCGCEFSLRLAPLADTANPTAH